MKKNVHSGRVELVRKWFDKWVTIKTLLSVVYVLVVIRAWPIVTEDPDNSAFIPVMAGLVSCLILIYFAVAGLLNKTKIIIEHESIKVKNYPLPFPGGKTYKNGNIVEYHIRSNFNPRRILQRVRFEIHALTDYGQQFKVLNGIPCSHQAEMIRNEHAELNRY